jgi:hypothetical protein
MKNAMMTSPTIKTRVGLQGRIKQAVVEPFVNGKITGAGFQEDTEFHEFCDVVLGGMFKMPPSIVPRRIRTPPARMFRTVKDRSSTCSN